MIVQCDNCQKKYRVDDSKIMQKSLKVRCSNCKHTFLVKASHKVSENKNHSTAPKNHEIAQESVSEPSTPETQKTVKTEIQHLPDFAEWDDDIIVVTLPGDTLDAANCQDFKDAVHAILETPNNVIFNLEKINFVDSSGCGTLNASIKRIKKHGGDIKICNVLDQVAAIFRLIKLNRVFHICDTREDAISAYRSISV